MRFEVKAYLGYVGREVVQPTVYFFAAIIGSAICFLTSTLTVIPFLVPLFVQIMVRSSVKFRQRHRDALVELPAQKQDPVFIMDIQGRIILSVGKTRALFNQYDVSNIKSFLGEDAFEQIIASTLALGSADPVGIEAFSNMTLKWYEVKAAATELSYGDETPKVLVWFQDISLRKIYNLRLKDLLRYSDTLAACLKQDATRKEPVFRHLAVFLLKEYEGVFIARKDRDGDLKGYGFKVEHHKIVQSAPVCIRADSKDPGNRVCQTAGMVSDNLSNWDSQKSFSQAYPFEPSVLEFLGRPIRNFIGYGRTDTCITAFNFRSDISVHEQEFFKVVGKVFGTMVLVADLKMAARNPDQNLN